MKRLLLVAILVAVCTPGLAVHEYYSLTRSTRALGMGGAFYGLSDDEYALFYNPAGLDIYRGPGKIMVSPVFGPGQISPTVFSAINTFSHLKGGSDANSINTIVNDIQQYSGQPLYVEGTPLFARYVHKHFSVGLLLGDTKGDLVFQGQGLTSNVDLTVISDTALVAGYANEVMPGLHVGANMKLVGRTGGQKTFSVVDFEQGSKLNLDPQSLGGFGVGIDMDIGAIYDLPVSPGLMTRVSATVSNLLGSQLPLARKGNRPPALTRMLSLGTSTVFSGWGPIDNFIVVADLAEFGIGGESDPDFGGRGGSLFKHVNFGVEMPMSWFIVRAGFHQGNYTLGVGFRAWAVQFDLATYGEELDSGVGRLTSRRYAAQLSLGWGAPPLPVMTDATFRQQVLHSKPAPAPETKPQPAPTEKTTPPTGTTPAPDKAAQPPKGDVKPEPGPKEEEKTLEKTAPNAAKPEAKPSSTPATPAKGSESGASAPKSQDIQSVTPESIAHPGGSPAVTNPISTESPKTP